VVEDIESFGPELQLEPVRNTERLKDGSIGRPVAGAYKCPPSRTGDCSDCFRWLVLSFRPVESLFTANPRNLQFGLKLSY
jgi:hypothetical protein